MLAKTPFAEYSLQAPKIQQFPKNLPELPRIPSEMPINLLQDIRMPSDSNSNGKTSSESSLLSESEDEGIKSAKLVIQNYQPQSNLIPTEFMQDQTNVYIISKHSFYYGQVQDNKKQGFGIQVYNNSRIYEGYWNQNQKNGQGFEKFQQGNNYYGQFKDGKPNGTGIYRWAKGEFYQGNWLDGQRHGNGLWKGKNKEYYEGQWKYGKMDGTGRYCLGDEIVYQGEFKNGMKHGQGKEMIQDILLYQGQFENGRRKTQKQKRQQNYRFSPIKKNRLLFQTEHFQIGEPQTFKQVLKPITPKNKLAFPNLQSENRSKEAQSRNGSRVCSRLRCINQTQTINSSKPHGRSLGNTSLKEKQQNLIYEL